MTDTDMRRLRWRCRRGQLELDLVLQAYLDREYPGADAIERQAFTRLLAEPDSRLLEWVNGAMEGVDPDLKEIVRKLQKLTVYNN
jgi:antitoxin CptB